MQINADFSSRAVIERSDELWVESPMKGVDRIMLDRIGEEVARATSIVRYAAGSYFSRHMHPEGEEFLVLEGVFSDEHSDYTTGMYVRNPPGTGHSPHSEDGCRILVKLRQFDAEDLTPVCIDTSDESLWRDGRLALYQYGDEVVSMQRLADGDVLEETAGPGGVELLVVSGGLEHDGRHFPAESWFRFPQGDNYRLIAVGDVTIWQKTGHLQAD